MEARKNPEYLAAVARAVEDFRAALVEFLELHVANDAGRSRSRPRAGVPVVLGKKRADTADQRRSSLLAVPVSAWSCGRRVRPRWVSRSRAGRRSCPGDGGCLP